MSQTIEYHAVAPRPTEEFAPEQADAYQHYLTATQSLHPYPSTVVSRESMTDPVELPYAKIYEEKVTFTDGSVRALTHVDPNKRHFAPDQLNPYLVSSGDSLCTGPNGFNATVIDQLARRGFAVAWLHHQDSYPKQLADPRNAVRLGRMLFNDRYPEQLADPRNALQFGRMLLKKSVGRSAHHQHGMLDSLAQAGDHDTETILSIGDSRSAMTGEAVDALAGMYDRTVMYSDYYASCFEHRPTLGELPGLAFSLPLEGKALRRLQRKLQQDPDYEIGDYRGTFNLSPVNILHEAAWLLPLMRGDAGRYGDAVPLDQNGVRTHLDGDIWSSGGKAWESKYSIRPNIHLIRRTRDDGHKARHLDFADPDIQRDRLERLERVTEEIHAGHTLPTQLDMRYVVKGMRSVSSRAS